MNDIFENFPNELNLNNFTDFATMVAAKTMQDRKKNGLEGLLTCRLELSNLFIANAFLTKSEVDKIVIHNDNKQLSPDEWTDRVLDDILTLLDTVRKKLLEVDNLQFKDPDWKAGFKEGMQITNQNQQNVEPDKLATTVANQKNSTHQRLHFPPEIVDAFTEVATINVIGGEQIYPSDIEVLTHSDHPIKSPLDVLKALEPITNYIITSAAEESPIKQELALIGEQHQNVLQKYHLDIALDETTKNNLMVSTLYGLGGRYPDIVPVILANSPLIDLQDGSAHLDTPTREKLASELAEDNYIEAIKTAASQLPQNQAQDLINTTRDKIAETEIAQTTDQFFDEPPVITAPPDTVEALSNIITNSIGSTETPEEKLQLTQAVTDALVTGTNTVNYPLRPQSVEKLQTALENAQEVVNEPLDQAVTHFLTNSRTKPSVPTTTYTAPTPAPVSPTQQLASSISDIMVVAGVVNTPQVQSAIADLAADPLNATKPLAIIEKENKAPLPANAIASLDQVISTSTPFIAAVSTTVSATTGTIPSWSSPTIAEPMRLAQQKATAGNVSEAEEIVVGKVLPQVVKTANTSQTITQAAAILHNNLVATPSSQSDPQDIMVEKLSEVLKNTPVADRKTAVAAQAHHLGIPVDQAPLIADMVVEKYNQLPSNASVAVRKETIESTLQQPLPSQPFTPSNKIESAVLATSYLLGFNTQQTIQASSALQEVITQSNQTLNTETFKQALATKGITGSTADKLASNAVQAIKDSSTTKTVLTTPVVDKLSQLLQDTPIAERKTTFTTQARYLGIPDDQAQFVADTVVERYNQLPSNASSNTRREVVESVLQQAPFNQRATDSNKIESAILTTSHSLGLNTQQTIQASSALQEVASQAIQPNQIPTQDTFKQALAAKGITGGTADRLASNAYQAIQDANNARSVLTAPTVGEYIIQTTDSIKSPSDRQAAIAQQLYSSGILPAQQVTSVAAKITSDITQSPTPPSKDQQVNIAQKHIDQALTQPQTPTPVEKIQAAVLTTSYLVDLKPTDLAKANQAIEQVVKEKGITASEQDFKQAFKQAGFSTGTLDRVTTVSYQANQNPPISVGANINLHSTLSATLISSQLDSSQLSNPTIAPIVERAQKLADSGQIHQAQYVIATEVVPKIAPNQPASNTIITKFSNAVSVAGNDTLTPTILAAGITPTTIITNKQLATQFDQLHTYNVTHTPPSQVQDYVSTTIIPTFTAANITVPPTFAQNLSTTSYVAPTTSVLPHITAAAISAKSTLTNLPTDQIETAQRLFDQAVLKNDVASFPAIAANAGINSPVAQSVAQKAVSAFESTKSRFEADPKYRDFIALKVSSLPTNLDSDTARQIATSIVQAPNKDAAIAQISKLPAIQAAQTATLTSVTIASNIYNDTQALSKPQLQTNTLRDIARVTHESKQQGGAYLEQQLQHILPISPETAKDMSLRLREASAKVKITPNQISSILTDLNQPASTTSVAKELSQIGKTRISNEKLAEIVVKNRLGNDPAINQILQNQQDLAVVMLAVTHRQDRPVVLKESLTQLGVNAQTLARLTDKDYQRMGDALVRQIPLNVRGQALKNPLLTEALMLNYARYPEGSPMREVTEKLFRNKQTYELAMAQLLGPKVSEEFIRQNLPQITLLMAQLPLNEEIRLGYAQLNHYPAAVSMSLEYLKSSKPTLIADITQLQKVLPDRMAAFRNMLEASHVQYKLNINNVTQLNQTLQSNPKFFAFVTDLRNHVNQAGQLINPEWVKILRMAKGHTNLNLLLERMMPPKAYAQFTNLISQFNRVAPLLQAVTNPVDFAKQQIQSAVMRKLASTAVGKAVTAALVKTGLATTIKTLSAALPPGVNILVAALSNVIANVASKVGRILKDNIPALIGGLVGMGIAITSGSVLAGIGSGLVTFVGTSMLTGSTSSVGGAVTSLVSFIATGIAFVVGAFITPVIISAAIVPISIAFFLFIMNNSAFVLPVSHLAVTNTGPGSGGTIPGPPAPGPIYNGPLPSSCPSIWPTVRGDITQGAYTNDSHANAEAIDIGSPIRSTDDAIATHDGVAIPLNTGNSLGNYVDLYSSCDISGKTVYFLTRYAHLSGFNVSRGQLVKKGDPIGKIGGSGGWSVHLHYEMRISSSRTGTVPSTSISAMYTERPPFQWPNFIPKIIKRACVGRTQCLNVSIP